MIEWLSRRQDWLVGAALAGTALVFVIAMIAITVWLMTAGAETQQTPLTIKLPQSSSRYDPPPAAPILLVSSDSEPEYAIEVLEYPATPVPEQAAANLPLLTTTTATPTPIQLEVGVDLLPLSPLTGWPSGGRVTQNFGCSPFYTGVPDPTCPDEAPWFHSGLDIANLEGAPVRAALPGVVIFAGEDSDGPACGDYRGFGLSVMVDAGDWETLYAHLSRIEVEPGQTVEPGTIIGAVGQTGCAGGPHLHFGLRYRGLPVDPVMYVAE